MTNEQMKEFFEVSVESEIEALLLHDNMQSLEFSYAMILGKIQLAKSIDLISPKERHNKKEYAFIIYLKRHNQLEKESKHSEQN